MLKSCVLVIYISYTQKFVPEAMRKSYEYNVVTFQKKESCETIFFAKNIKLSRKRKVAENFFAKKGKSWCCPITRPFPIEHARDLVRPNRLSWFFCTAA